MLLSKSPGWGIYSPSSSSYKQKPYNSRHYKSLQHRPKPSSKNNQIRSTTATSISQINIPLKPTSSPQPLTSVSSTKTKRPLVKMVSKETSTTPTSEEIPPPETSQTEDTTPAMTPPGTPGSPPLKRKRESNGEDLAIDSPESKRRSTSPEPAKQALPEAPASPKSPKRANDDLGEIQQQQSPKRARSQEPVAEAKLENAASASTTPEPSASAKDTPEPSRDSSVTTLDLDEKEGEEEEEQKYQFATLPDGLEVEFVKCPVGVAAAAAAALKENREEMSKEAEKTAKELRALADSIPPSERNFAGIGAKGMSNPNTLCYRISAMQVLLHNPKFVAWVESLHTADDCASGKEEGYCVTCNLRRLVEVYWDRSTKQRALDEVMTDLDVIFNDLEWECGGNNGQGDPEDQWLWLLNQIEAEVGAQPFKKLTSTNTISLNSTMACTLCGDLALKSNVKEGLLSIYLDGQSKKKRGEQAACLEKYLDRYFQGEVIEGHRCDKCGKSSDKSRKFEIAYCPDVLTVQLCRFDPFGGKICTEIDYPETLDLSPYLINQGTPAKYKLNGVITHAGGGTRSGHYRSLVKNPADGSWTLVDDEMASASRLETALQPKKAQHPYVLSYIRVEEA